MKVRVADYVIDRLAREGASNVFQLTGRGALFLNDAVAKSSDVRGISMHHEQACAYAAIAAAEQTNNIGVCLVSTGCAATNTITGVLCAWQDGIPLIVISGQKIIRKPLLMILAVIFIFPFTIDYINDFYTYISKELKNIKPSTLHTNFE